MKRWFLTGLLAAIALLYMIAPEQASAYSYGDANTEDVAETYKLIESELSAATPNWTAADEAYKVRRSEISAHFGEEVAVTLDQNLSARDRTLLIANFRAVLVLNLERRFTYSLQGIDDYAATKILLAKAKATYDTLAPYINPKPADIDKAFDEALNALGNPGLFGVGKRAAQPELFKAKVDGIYNLVKPLFPYRAASAAPTPTAAPPTAKPQETPAAVVTPAPTVALPTPSTAPSASPAATMAPSASVSPTETPAASASPSAMPSATPALSATPAPTAAATSKPADVSATSSSSVKEAAAHAPMELTDKTNPLVSIFVIAGIVILAGAGIWLARKKKWI